MKKQEFFFILKKQILGIPYIIYTLSFDSNEQELEKVGYAMDKNYFNKVLQLLRLKLICFLFLIMFRIHFGYID